MKCAIHQPQFLPWLGYLNKIASADVFVFLDTVQFKKNEFQNRNRVRAGDESKWITVPVSFSFGDTVRQTKIAGDPRWRRKMRATIEQNYHKAGHFAEYSSGLFSLIEREWDNLAEINMATVRWLMEVFEIRTEIMVASEMNIEGGDNATDRLVRICRSAGADVYISGQGGRGYLDTAEFEKSGIRVEFQDYLHPEYVQCYSKQQGLFLPCLSAIDGLFNCGGGEDGSRRLNLSRS